VATQGTAETALETEVEPPRETAAEADSPGRYRVVADEGGNALLCGNATNLRLRVAKGLTVNKRGRRQYRPQTIFLDGVYGGAPFCDNEARHYSLDHHAGCVRGFTLATCEQAVVMLLQGLPLGVGDWTLYVNDPDLDSVMAAWVLMNHLELLRSNRELLRGAMPLIRLEGVIDAHGTDMELLAALPADLHARTRAQIDELMRRERELKSAGKWFSTDWNEYTRTMLETLDALLYPEDMLAELRAIQESGRATLGDRMAVLIKSTDGIYEVEARLKKRYGSLLGLVVLEQGGGRFTLRQVDTFLKKDLDAVYKVLNRNDPKARLDGESPNVWGGSGNIGGAPRQTGSGLTGEEILTFIGQVLGPRESWWKRLGKRAWRRILAAARRESPPPALPPGSPPEASPPAASPSAASPPAASPEDADDGK
jgi:hypothetical protein